MTPYQAQRIRFGILAARHVLERDRLTPDQIDYIEGCRGYGWGVGHNGTVKAFREESDAALGRKYGL